MKDDFYSEENSRHTPERLASEARLLRLKAAGAKNAVKKAQLENEAAKLEAEANRLKTL